MDHADGTPSITARAVHFEEKSASDTRSTLVTNQSSAAAASDGTAESTSSPKSGFSSGKRSGFRKKFGVKRPFKTSVDLIKGFVSSFFYCNSGSCPYVRMSYRCSFVLFPLVLY